ncbi:MAG: PA2779 family protein [Gammaproteobacteria bacterium]|nr:PA2779 family protein [Gammaproteobacteria bacterium]
MRKILAVITAHIFLGATLFAPVAQAGIVTTGEYLQQQEVAEKRAEIMDKLQREEVRAHLTDLGVDATTVEARVAALSDAEVMQMAAEMEEMPAGGDALGVLVTVLLVLLILELLGVTDVFPAVDSA